MMSRTKLLIIVLLIAVHSINCETGISTSPELAALAPLAYDDADAFYEPDLVPHGFCADQLTLTKGRLHSISLAQRCIQTGVCVLDNHYLRLSEEFQDRMAASGNQMVDSLHASTEEIQTMLEVQYSSNDWKRLTQWNDAKEASLLWGHPTLRLRGINLGGMKNASGGGDGIQASDDLLCPTSYSTRPADIYANGFEDSCGYQGGASTSSMDAPTGGELNRIFGFRSSLTPISSTQECPLRCPIRLNAVKSLLSNLQDPPMEAQMCFVQSDRSPFVKQNPSINRQLAEDEAVVTFLDPLGSGKEAEVWRVCVHGKPKSSDSEKGADGQLKSTNQSPMAKVSAAEIVALKVYRRQYRMPRPGKRGKSAMKPFIPSFPLIWEKTVASFIGTLELGSVIPMDVAVVPLQAWNFEGSGFRFVAPSRYVSINRYTVYLGYGASFEVAEADLSVYGHRYDNGRVPVHMLPSLTRDLVQALKVVEATGHVWMDFKPENFLVVDGKAKIGDIGFMRPIGELMKLPGIGTPGFRPFEAFLRSSSSSSIISSERAVFALGVTLYHLIFARLPWSENDIKRMASRATRHQRYELDFGSETVVDHELKTLLHGLLHPNPRYRIKLADILDHPYFDK